MSTIGRDQPQPHRIGILFQVFKTNQLVETLVTYALSPCDLRGDDYAAYSYLHVNGPATPTALARAMGMPPTTMSGHSKRWIERGHVGQSANPEDGRSHLLQLTPGGTEYMLWCIEVFSERVQAFVDQLDEQHIDSDAVLATLDSVQKALEAGIDVGVRDHENTSAAS